MASDLPKVSSHGSGDGSEDLFWPFQHCSYRLQPQEEKVCEPFLHSTCPRALVNVRNLMEETHPAPVSTHSQQPSIQAWLQKSNQGFPGGAVVENLPANAGDAGSIPGLGGSHVPWSN